VGGGHVSVVFGLIISVFVYSSFGNRQS